MNDIDKKEFASVLTVSFDTYGRKKPDPDTMRMWFEIFKSISLEDFKTLCMKHIATSPKDPPTPAALIAISRSMCGVPSDDEAWSIALKAMDERETVMMNDHIAEAYGVAKPIFDMGDKVGARMAFKKAYSRLSDSHVGPIKWFPSLGSDVQGREMALQNASNAGLLSSNHEASLMISGPKDSPEGLKKLMDVIKGIPAISKKKREERVEFAKSVIANKERNNVNAYANEQEGS